MNINEKSTIKVSFPHVKINPDMDGRPKFHISSEQKYKSPDSMLVEGDASSASYFIAGAAITGGTVKVRGCGSESVQGDVAFANVMEQMGATVTLCAPSTLIQKESFSPGSICEPHPFNRVEIESDLGKAIKGADVVMPLRLQKERQSPEA